MSYNAYVNNKKQKQEFKNMPKLKMKFEKDDHRIDVNTYASALSALSIIATEVNYETHKDSDIQLNVVAQEEGSFESVIEFVCLAGPIITELGKPIIDVLRIIIELYKLKQISHEADFTKTQSVDADQSQIIMQNGNNGPIVNNVTLNIFNNNQTVQDAVSSTFKRLDRDDAVSGFKMSADEEEVFFSKGEFGKMSEKMTIEPEPQEEETKSVTLIVVKPVLKKSSNKWSFFMSGSEINADIKDEAFLNDVESGKYSFTAGDRLMVELLIKNEYSQQYKIYLPKHYSIIKVKSHMTAEDAVQMEML